ncbi:16S rRNA (uracil(1498)-N(3))-methyltransferase [Ascidiimonas aurantiaca]|uniref:16S rRNA (uracil(1498)-N(3))-methyltransferase n=1 Tax=Ascidiimonas aurantiaca TaxID=1685432 RepID=UPI0030EF2CFB
MQLFYHPEITADTTVFAFESDESKHIVKVLRKVPGDLLEITNGKGFFFTVKLVDTHTRNCKAEVVKTQKVLPRKYQLHIAIAPTKTNDRFEWFLEKATEIGIDSITPLFCKNSERKIIKKERYKKVMLSAMKQSLQSFLPRLNDPVSFHEFIAQEQLGQLFIAHCHAGERFSFKRKIQPDQPTTILIGPEGDFTEEEVQQALRKGFMPITLGHNRLRTETAGLVACTTVALCNL